jgi:hypothetical protein
MKLGCRSSREWGAEAARIRNQLKTHEIAGQMFDNGYDLAIAIIDGMTARSQKNGHTLERFKFNSA